MLQVAALAKARKGKQKMRKSKGKTRQQARSGLFCSIATGALSHGQEAGMPYIKAALPLPMAKKNMPWDSGANNICYTKANKM